MKKLSLLAVLVSSMAFGQLSVDEFVNPILAPSATIKGNLKAGSLSVSGFSLSGTNTGDVTLGTANGLSLVGQTFSLGLASATTSGAMSFGTQTFAGVKTFNDLVNMSVNLQVNGTLIAAGPGVIHRPVTLATCALSIEGQLSQDALSGASTGARTRLCLCTSNGSAVYAWQNVALATVKSTSRIKMDRNPLLFLTSRF